MDQTQNISDERLAVLAKLDCLAGHWETSDCHICERRELARELRTLRAELAEKDAAIEKARRDSLEVSRKAADEICGCFNIETPRGVRYARGIKGIIAIIIEQRIRALAAQKKEG